MTTRTASITSPLAHTSQTVQEQTQTSAPPNPIFRLAIKTIIQLIRYWWVLGGAMVVSLFTAIFLSGAIAETVWTVESVIVYMRLPIDSAAERLYVPPDLRTVTSLAKSPAILKTAVENAELNMSPRGLSSMLTIEEPRGTQKLSVKLTHVDPKEGCRIVSAVVEAFQGHVADMRRAQVKHNLQDLETSLKRNDLRMKASNERLSQFAGTNNVDDLDTELQSLVGNISSMEFQLSTSKVEAHALRIQRDSVQDQLNNQKKDEQLKLASEKEAEAAEESLADNRRRQDRLNELIAEERRLNEIRARLEARQGEFNRKLVLFEKGYLSRNDFEVIQANVDALKSQIMEGTKIGEWQAELQRIDKMVVPKAKNRRIGSPIIHQTMFKLVELELQILAAEESQRQLAMSLVEARRRQNELKRYQVEQSSFLAEIHAIADERDSLNTQYSALTSVHDIGPYEFAIAQPPTSDMYPPASNRKKMFVITFAGVNLMLVTPVLLLALLTANRQTVMEYGEDQKIPFLTRRPSLTDLIPERTEDVVREETANWCRTVALRVQQLSPRRGAVVSIVPGKPYQYETDLKLLKQIASVLAQRDERVLIIQFPPTSLVGLPEDSDEDDLTNQVPDDQCGIFDYANDESLKLSDILHSVTDGVDLISGGSCDQERLFSQRMTSLLDDASEQYSLILTYGIVLHESTNVEMLSRHSDGLVVFHDRMDLMSREIAETIESLKLLKAPLFGFAVRVGAERRPRIRFLFRHRRTRKQKKDKEQVDTSRLTTT